MANETDRSDCESRLNARPADLMCLCLEFISKLFEPPLCKVPSKHPDVPTDAVGRRQQFSGGFWGVGRQAGPVERHVMVSKRRRRVEWRGAMQPPPIGSRPH